MNYYTKTITINKLKLIPSKIMVTIQKATATDLKRIINAGYLKQPLKSPYESARYEKDGVVIIYYKSGKLLFQGKSNLVEPEIQKLFPQAKTKIKQTTLPSTDLKIQKSQEWVIGSDECLKGDTFGGIIVAAVKANAELRTELIKLGVADSKTIPDQKIILLAQKIKQQFPCAVRSLLPTEYNNKEGNVTALLNLLHKEVVKDLSPGYHIVDKYPGCTVGDCREEKAESKYPEVAAASILARAAGLEQLQYLSRLAGFQVPKGSTHVKEALQKVKDKNLPFVDLVKLDFKNVKEFLSK